MAAPITRISVAGYKSIVEEQSIEIAPLTILAGANSSGKSSMMQPLLLLKQTLEAPYDPGPLKLNGPILKFSSAEQFMSVKSSDERELRISIHAGSGSWRITLVKRRGEPIRMIESGGRVFESLGPHEAAVKLDILEMIHVRGLRGNPERTYPVTTHEEYFPGVFDNYVASVIQGRNLELIDEVTHLELGRAVRARAVNDAEVEVTIQTSPSGPFFNVADVGFAVSQVLPVLVALRAAKANRLVYIEQPELHLHPRAQTRMADILAAAANRGVRAVVETHSSLLLTAIQTLIAKKQLSPDDVRLHWFQLDPHTGHTKVTTAALDENGAFGDWPEDFDEVLLSTEREYLDAVESRVTH